MSTRTITYGTEATGSGGITSLSASSALTSGWVWYIADNSTDLALDRIQRGTIRNASGPYNGEIRIYAIASYDGSTWPDSFTGSTGTFNFTSAGVRDSVAKLAWAGRQGSATVTATMGFEFSLAELFGGYVPKKVAIFVTHSLTATQLNSLDANHVYYDIPVYETVA